MDEKHEVIIVGGGYGALVCGAILAKNGVKPLVVEKLDILGGTSTAIEIPKHKGYFTEMGHRDHHDFGDVFNVMGYGARHGLEASERAGANVQQIFTTPMLLGHKLPEGRITPITFEPELMPDIARDYLQLPDDMVPKFLEALEGTGKENVQELMSVTLGEWLSANVEEEIIREAFRHITIAMYYYPPDKMCMGRWIQLSRAFYELWRPNHPDFPGMAGLIQPYAGIIRDNGGEVRLGLKTLEIVVKDQKVTGIVVQDVSSYTEMLEAPVVVCNLNIWDALDVIDENLLPEDLVKNARKASRHQGDVMTYNAGLSRMPTIRADNRVEDFNGWNRVQRGPDWEYNGGWFFPSLTSDLMAPKGKHIVCAEHGSNGPGAFKNFKEAKGHVDRLVSYMREYYKDLEEVTEWEGYFLNKGPTIADWVFTGVPGAPMKAPTIEGLYFVGETVEVPGGFVGLHDIDAKSAMDVADMILEGHG